MRSDTREELTALKTQGLAVKKTTFERVKMEVLSDILQNPGLVALLRLETTPPIPFHA